MQSTEQRFISAYYIIYDSLASSRQLIAFRGSRINGYNGRKIIKCPNSKCNRRLTDVDEDTIVNLIQLPTRSEIKCHNYLKCVNCGTEVGINYV